MSAKGLKSYIHMYPFSAKLPSHPGCHITQSSSYFKCSIGYIDFLYLLSKTHSL